MSLVENYRLAQCLVWRLSPISTFFSLVSSRAFRGAPHSRFRCGDLNDCLLKFLKMLLLALPKIYTRAFHLWKSWIMPGLKILAHLYLFLLACFLELVESPWDLEIQPKLLEIDPKLVKITLRVARSRRRSSH